MSGLCGPGKSLVSGESPTQAQPTVEEVMQEFVGDCGIERPHLSSIAVKVNGLVQQNSQLKSLVCEILATMTLPSNAEHFKKLGPNWEAIVASWHRQFNLCNGEA